MYIEKFISEASNVRGAGFRAMAGNAIALGRRDCSAQRRNQK